MHVLKKIYLVFLIFVHCCICVFYPQCIFFYTVNFIFYILIEILTDKRERIICGGTSLFVPPQSWISDVINIFYYAALLKKTVSFSFGYSDFFLEGYNYNDQINLKTPVLYDTLRFFLEGRGDNITFFINRIGFIEKVAWINSFDTSLLEKNQILIRSMEEQAFKKYIIFTYHNVFTDMNRQAVYSFLSNFLKRAEK